MLMNSDINPFDSQEAKPYKNDPEIVALTNLVSAYMRHEIRTFEKLLKQSGPAVMGDPFIRAYIEDLLKNIRTQVRAARRVPIPSRHTSHLTSPHRTSPHHVISFSPHLSSHLTSHLTSPHLPLPMRRCCCA